MIKPFLLSGAALLMLSCSSTELAVPLEVKQSAQCHTPYGVRLLGTTTLEIALGSRSTSGYSIQHQVIHVRDGFKIDFQEQPPASGQHLAQVMTSPCIRLSLPSAWQHLYVKDANKHESWEFHQSQNDVDKQL